MFKPWLLIPALPLLLAPVFFIKANAATKPAEQWVRIITDNDKVVNYVDLASIKVKNGWRDYKSARIFSSQVTDADEIPLRRPYHGQRCPCPYDYAINESICGGRSAYSRPGGAEPTCYAPLEAKKELILNSVNCKTRQRTIHAINIYDSKGKFMTQYKAIHDTYPELVQVDDPAEVRVIKAVCSKK